MMSEINRRPKIDMLTSRKAGPISQRNKTALNDRQGLLFETGLSYVLGSRERGHNVTETHEHRDACTFLKYQLPNEHICRKEETISLGSEVYLNDKEDF